MERDEIIGLAREAGLTLWLSPEESKREYLAIERFAHLVAAEYKRDAKRYRWLRENKFKYNGHCQMLNGPILWEENLDAAVDAAMEKVK